MALHLSKAARDTWPQAQNAGAQNEDQDADLPADYVLVHDCVREEMVRFGRIQRRLITSGNSKSIVSVKIVPQRSDMVPTGGSSNVPNVPLSPLRPVDDGTKQDAIRASKRASDKIAAAS